MAFSKETRKQIRALAGNKCEMCGRSNDEYYCDCSHNNHSRTEIDLHTGQTFYDVPENGQLLCVPCHLEISDDPNHQKLIKERIDRKGLRRNTIYEGK